MKKYEMIYDDEMKMYRIKALIDIPSINVKVGNFGGFIEKENNLSHKDNCWIFDNAEVFGNARVYGNAIISGNARVYGDARVFRSSHTTIVKYFNLGKHIITVDGDYLNIGCKSYTIDKWLDKGKKIGKENNYTNKEIDIYMNFIKFIKEQRELGLI